MWVIRVRSCAISWPQRVGGEQRENVGEKQFLMLLFMVDASLDEPQDLGIRGQGLVKELSQRSVHMSAITRYRARLTVG